MAKARDLLNKTGGMNFPKPAAPPKTPLTKSDAQAHAPKADSYSKNAKQHATKGGTAGGGGTPTGVRPKV